MYALEKVECIFFFLGTQVAINLLLGLEWICGLFYCCALMPIGFSAATCSLLESTEFSKIQGAGIRT